MGAGIEPRDSAAEQGDREFAAAQVLVVDVGNFKLAARGRLQGTGDFDHLVVVDEEPGDRVPGFGVLGFLLDRDHFPGPVEFDYAGSFRILYRVGKDGRPRPPFGRRLQVIGKVMAVKNVVAEDQRAGPRSDETGADDEGLGQALGGGLDGVRNVKPPFAAVAEKLLETRRVLRG
ncbi:hypothetical protein D3C83_03260 [compost metagenome]